MIFYNEVFFTARILQISYGGRTLFLTLRPSGSAVDGVSVDLLVGDISLRIGLRDLSACLPLDSQLSKMALEVYPPEVQEILLESIFCPLLSALEGWLANPATIEAVHLKPISRKKTLPYQLQFSLYEENPHGGKSVPLLLSGSLSMDRLLAEKVLEAVRTVSPVPYRHYDSALPDILNGIVPPIAMAPEKLASLRTGDVILLEDSQEVRAGLRELIGLEPYRIRCRQLGDRATVLSWTSA
jgi:hypothetical protein